MATYLVWLRGDGRCRSRSEKRCPVRSVIVVHPDFDRDWPFAADHFAALWQAQGEVELVRLADDDRRPLGENVVDPASITRLVALHVPVTQRCIERLAGLREAVCERTWPIEDNEQRLSLLGEHGVTVYSHPRAGFWGQSVAEYGLALTLAGL